MNKTTVAKGIKGAQGKKAMTGNRPGFFGQPQVPSKRVINPRGMRKK
ncbi:MAG: hypothetical protein ACM3XN_04050 [Chloroflexota bacterium]